MDWFLNGFLFCVYVNIVYVDVDWFPIWICCLIEQWDALGCGLVCNIDMFDM